MPSRFGGAVCFSSLMALASSVYAQTGPAVGIVLSSRDSQVGGAPASPGVSVFSGDRLTTQKDSGLIVQAGKFQFWLHENTTATLVGRPQGVALELESGSISFSSATPELGLEIFISDLRIVPQAAAILRGQVLIRDPCQVLIASQQGALKILRGNEITEVPETQGKQVSPINPIEPRPKGVDLGDGSFHKAHAHKPCVQPAAVAKGNVMLWVPPVVFMQAATVTSILLARDKNVSPF